MNKTTLHRPKAYSYLRFSTPDQMQGDSFRRQLRRTREYASDHDLDLDESLNLQDLGVSAFRGKNSAEGRLGDFIEAVDNGRIKPGSYLLVENLDRLSRQDPYTAFSQFSALLRKGINIVTVSDGKTFSADSMDFSALMIAVVGMQRAYEESLTKSRRLAAAWEGKREKAYEGKIKFTSRCPAWLKLDKATQTFLERPERVAVVRRIFQMTLEGHGKRSITRTLNEEGVPTFGRSNGWQDSYIQKILQNEAVIGRYQPHTMADVDGKRKRVPIGEPIEDYFPPIIDKTTFYKVRGMRSAKATPTGRVGQNFSNLFTGLAFCGHCGAPMHFESKGKSPKGGTYLVCSAARRKANGCKRHSWNYPKTQCHIIMNLTEVDYTELFPQLFEQAQTKVTDLQDKLLVASEELHNILKRQDILLDQFEKNPEISAIKRRLTALESEEQAASSQVKALKAELDNETDSLAHAQTSYDELEGALEHFIELESSEALRDDRIQARRHLHQLLKRIVDKIVFTPDTSNPPKYHGIIEIFFYGASYTKRIKVEPGQADSQGYRVENGKEVIGITVPDAQWPPEGRVIGPAELWDIISSPD